MPRLPFSLVWHAHRIDPLLPLLLRECRDIRSARNELRWLTENARETAHPSKWQAKLRNMVEQRATGKPLQYILGDQPFGDLEILCRPGVLIPRPDTESYTHRIARVLLSFHHNQPDRHPTRILDLCTGTGCIPLLLHSLLAPSIPNLSIVGVDISAAALSLSKENLEYNIQKGNLLPRARQEVQFVHADILESDSLLPKLFIPLSGESVGPSSYSKTWDLLISNPPYISMHDFNNGTTKRSVRLYEPSLALVPRPQQEVRGVSINFTHAREDTFYPHLLAISAQLNSRFTVVECGSLAQARRVAKLSMEQLASEATERNNYCHETDRVSAEIWRCETPGPGHLSPLPFKAKFAGSIKEEQGPSHGARAVMITRD
ncbi:hypothetical protein FQN57_001647 [Myotisia sp. PD_48]|nr:hypothetical protein FQN57_001647 [Myotisia sp. PD_48]